MYSPGNIDVAGRGYVFEWRMVLHNYFGLCVILNWKERMAAADCCGQDLDGQVIHNGDKPLMGNYLGGKVVRR